MGDFDKYLDGSDSIFTETLSLGGGAALGVIGTRMIDRYAADRLHPLALFGAKALVALGVGTAVYRAGYPNLAAGLAFGAFTDSTIRYADQVDVRYILPGAP